VTPEQIDLIADRVDAFEMLVAAEALHTGSLSPRNPGDRGYPVLRQTSCQGRGGAKPRPAGKELLGCPRGVTFWLSCWRRGVRLTAR
jgi:hypothetical protein